MLVGAVWFKALLPPGIDHCLIFIEPVPLYLLHDCEMEFIFFKLVLNKGRKFKDAELVLPRNSNDALGSLHFNLKSAVTGATRDGNAKVLIHRLLAFTFFDLRSDTPPKWDLFWDVDHHENHRCNLLRNLRILRGKTHDSLSGRKRKSRN